MRFLPVVVRELRAEARNPLNYWLRALTAGLAAIIFLAVSLYPKQRSSVVPGHLFSGLNCLIYFALCLLVPVLTADSLSREKREGTLGLLFLTPLTATGIVLAKSVSHAVRSLSLVLAALPVMSAVFLLGGVSWQQVVLALLVDVNALMMGLAAGILASSASRVWGRSVSLALLLFFGLICLSWFALIGSFCLLEGRAVEGPFWYALIGAGYVVTQIGTLELPPLVWGHLMDATVISVIATLLMLVVLFLSAARLVRAMWQDRPLSRRQLRWRDFFCSPRFLRTLLKRRMQRALDANPMGWLQQYSWNARLTKWGWCLVFVALEMLTVASSSSYLSDYAEWQMTLGGLLLLGVAFSAAASFIRERRNGAMELILVTPMTLRQIVVGRLWGIWSQYVPALAILALAAGAGPVSQRPPPPLVLFVLSSFAMLPLIGLFFSLRQKAFLSAWFLTAAVGMGLPLFGGVLLAGGSAFVRLLLSPGGGAFDLWMFSETFTRELTQSPFWVALFAGQILLADGMWRLLQRTLRDRTFAVNLS